MRAQDIESSFESGRSRAIGAGGFAQCNSRTRLQKMIGRLKQAGEVADGVFESETCGRWSNVSNANCP